MRKIIILILFCVLYVNVNGQRKQTWDIHCIDKLKVINENLFSILDSIIVMKSNVTYFKEGKIFTIWFGLDSIKPDLILIYAEGKKIIGQNHDLGLFEYKNHTFFVRGDSLNKTIFENTNCKSKVNFSQTQFQYTKDGTPIFDMRSLRELWCVWTCRYKDDKFKLLSFFSSDKNLPYFDNVEDEYLCPTLGVTCK